MLIYFFYNFTCIEFPSGEEKLEKSVKEPYPLNRIVGIVEL